MLTIASLVVGKRFTVVFVKVARHFLWKYHMLWVVINRFLHNSKIYHVCWKYQNSINYFECYLVLDFSSSVIIFSTNDLKLKIQNYIIRLRYLYASREYVKKNRLCKEDNQHFAKRKNNINLLSFYQVLKTQNILENQKMFRDFFFFFSLLNGLFNCFKKGNMWLLWSWSWNSWWIALSRDTLHTIAGELTFLISFPWEPLLFPPKMES